MLTAEQAGGRLVRRENDDGSLVLFDDRKGQGPGRTTASERLAEWMNGQSPEYLPVWIDLEGQYTIAGVVGAVIDGCRAYDRTLPPAVLPLDDKDAVKGAERIAQALLRGRYAVAFDGLDLLAWPPTHHHGVPTYDDDGRIRPLLQGFADLIGRIAGTLALRSSRIALSVNPPIGRATGSVTPAADPLEAAVNQIKPLVPNVYEVLETEAVTAPPVDATDGPLVVPSVTQEDCLAAATDLGCHFDRAHEGEWRRRLTLALFAICCFRRTRTLVILRHLLGPLFPGQGRRGYGPYSQVDAVLEAFRRRGYFIQMEGGLFWMKRPIRDEIYRSNSLAVTTSGMRALLSAGATAEGVRRGIVQLALLAQHHARIARSYYDENWLVTKDAAAFFEYVYHRISGTRYRTKLAVLLKRAARHHVEAARLACQDLAGLLQADDPPPPEYGGPTGAKWSDGRTGYLNVVRDAGGGHPLGEVGRLMRATCLGRQAEIVSLRIAWENSEEMLRSQVPAEQVITWCRWILTDDLNRLLSSYHPRPEGERGAGPSAAAVIREGSPAVEKDPPLTEPDVAPLPLDGPVFEDWLRLRERLYRLWISSARERDDLAEMRKACGHFFARVQAETADLAADDDKAPEDQRSGWAKGAQGVARLAREMTDGLAISPGDDPVGASKGLTAAVTEFFTGVNEQGETKLRITNRGKRYLQSLLRRLIDLASLQFRSRDHNAVLLDALRDTKVTGSVADELPLRILSRRAEVLSELLRSNPSDTSTALALIRWSEQGRDEARRAEYTEKQGQDRTPYFQYRARFLLHQARASWVLGREKEPADATPREFLLAFEDIQRARGWIDQLPNWTDQARADLAAAECSYELANWWLKSPTDQKSVQDRIGVELDHCRGYLSRALKHLFAGRRNVLWWADYYRLSARRLSLLNHLRLIELCGSPKELLAWPGTTAGEEVDKLVESKEVRDRLAHGFVPLLIALRRGLHCIKQVRDLSLEVGSRREDQTLKHLLRVTLAMSRLAEQAIGRAKRDAPTPPTGAAGEDIYQFASAYLVEQVRAAGLDWPENFDSRDDSPRQLGGHGDRSAVDADGDGDG